MKIERSHSSMLTAPARSELIELCDAAYREDTSGYFDDLGPGEHLLGREDDGRLVSHLMWVTRWLQPANREPLRTAYVELVATAPDVERRGHASALLKHFVPLVSDFELAALCPATEHVYARLGWTFWRGPLAIRKDGKTIATPEERVMILPLPLTPTLNRNAPLSVEWRPGEVW